MDDWWRRVAARLVVAAQAARWAWRKASHPELPTPGCETCAKLGRRCKACADMDWDANQW